MQDFCSEHRYIKPFDIFEDCYRSTYITMLPLSLLKTFQGHPMLPLSLLKTSQGHPMFDAVVAGGLTAEKGKRKHVPTAADESGILKSNNYNSLTSSKKEFGISDGDDISEKHFNPRIPAATLAYVDRKLVNRRPLKPAAPDYYRIRQQSRRAFKAWFRELLTGVLNNLSRNQLMQRQCKEECLGLARLLSPMETALLDWLMNLMADVSRC
ncbi:hypothetical protein Tco_1084884 [Tanacetum coccineum]